MHRTMYRGYTLWLNEKVTISRDGEDIDVADSLAEATERIDTWLVAS